MADTVAELRLERNEMLAREMRRARGASEAKKERIKQRARKLQLASVNEEQTLVARLGVYCDLVLMGKASWDQYHNELTLGGQKEAVVESMGGACRRTSPVKPGGQHKNTSSRRPPSLSQTRIRRTQGTRTNRRLATITGLNYLVRSAIKWATGVATVRINWMAKSVTRSRDKRRGIRKKRSVRPERPRPL